MKLHNEKNESTCIVSDVLLVAYTVNRNDSESNSRRPRPGDRRDGLLSTLVQSVSTCSY